MTAIGKSIAVAILVSMTMASTSLAQMRLGVPDELSHITSGTNDPRTGCGLRADYAFQDQILRVELMAIREAEKMILSLKVFSPQSVSPPMRDIWLKTPTYFTLGMLPPGRVNAKGFMESTGSLDLEVAKILLNEVLAGGSEISLVFDGTLPHARVPVALPEPLPPDVAEEFRQCGDRLLQSLP